MIYLYGASGHGKVVKDILGEDNLEIGAYIDDNIHMLDFYGSRVCHSIEEAFLKDQAAKLIISIGNNKTRKRISEAFSGMFAIAIHPKASISKTAILGGGTVVMGNVTINADVLIGMHVILNTSCSIDHDCRIEDYVHIAPNVALAGNVEVGEGAQIGIGSTVIQGVRLGKWTIIGAGAVVTKDIPDFAVAVGVPARIIKYNDKF